MANHGRKKTKNTGGDVVVRKKRGRSVPAPDWFLLEMEKYKNTDGSEMKHTQMRALVLRRTGQDISLHKIGRMRRGEIVTIELIDAVSRGLGLPLPVVFTSSLAEAHRIERARRQERAEALAEDHRQDRARRLEKADSRRDEYLHERERRIEKAEAMIEADRIDRVERAEAAKDAGLFDLTSSPSSDGSDAADRVELLVASATGMQAETLMAIADALRKLRAASPASLEPVGIAKVMADDREVDPPDQPDPVPSKTNGQREQRPRIPRR